jgi:hypothetical protein
MDIEVRTECQEEFRPTMGIIAFERPATSAIKIKKYNLKCRRVPALAGKA